MTFNVRKKRRGAPLAQGDEVRIAGHVACDGDAGGQVNLHGDGGTVIGANPHYRHKSTGERMTAVRLENGAVVTVPTRALRRD